MGLTVSHSLSATTPNDIEKRRAYMRAWYRKNKTRLLAKYRINSKRRFDENPQRQRDATRASYFKHHEKALARKAVYRAAHPEKHRIYSREYYKKNPVAARSYYEANRDKYREQYRKWSKANPDKEAARAARRRALKRGATPAWANKIAIDVFYTEARNLTKNLDIPFEVDHIVPLKGRDVCGLHWEGNLQILSAEANMQKGNRWA